MCESLDKEKVQRFLVGKGKSLKFLPIAFAFYNSDDESLSLSLFCLQQRFTSSQRLGLFICTTKVIFRFALLFVVAVDDKRNTALLRSTRTRPLYEVYDTYQTRVTSVSLLDWAQRDQLHFVQLVARRTGVRINLGQI